MLECMELGHSIIVMKLCMIIPFTEAFLVEILSLPLRKESRFAPKGND